VALPYSLTRALPTAADTARLGAALAAACRAQAYALAAHGLQVALRGELGAGKTALVRGWLRALGIAGPIRSPTFAVVEPYRVALAPPRVPHAGLEVQPDSSLDFYHFDFYRFADPAEFAAGFREHFGPGAICAVEWPEKAGDRLPPADLAIELSVEGAGRRAELTAASERGHACLLAAAREFDTTAAG
jgi:tRNA threonylcarbamoyladenosine biosynthesis protein TsaE